MISHTAGIPSLQPNDTLLNIRTGQLVILDVRQIGCAWRETEGVYGWHANVLPLIEGGEYLSDEEREDMYEWVDFIYLKKPSPLELLALAIEDEMIQ